MLDGKHIPNPVPVSFAQADSILVPWVAERIGIAPEDFGKCTAMGVWLGDYGEIACAVVYHDFRINPDGNLMSASIAQDKPGWACRRVLRDMFRYPFEQMGVTRFSTMASRRNKRARKFNERLGFRFEGVARRGWNGKDDAFSYSMFPEECRWLEA